MASNTSITNLPVQAQQGILSYLEHCRSHFQTYYSIRAALENIDRTYYRELDWTKDHQRAKLANRVGDAAKFQDVTVPIVMPQVEAYVTYQTSVFLTGNPIFGVVSSPKYQDAAMQLETVIQEQATKGAWTAELIKFFRDQGKYNLGAVEISWDKITTPVFETDSNFSTTQAKPKNVIWEGNRLKRMDLYNTFWDTSVHPSDVARFGEYAGYNELISRTHLKQDIAALDDVMVGNVKAGFDSGTPLQYFYTPQINPDTLVNLSQLTGDADWFAWAGVSNGRSDIAYKSKYIKTTLYVRLLPSEFGIKVPQPNTPQVWKFIIVNFTSIIYAERQTNAHEMLPILFACPNDDGIKYQSKGVGANAQPMQQLASAFMNATVASKRRAISDRGIYNPLYISKEDINNTNPAAKIACKPTAYAGVSLSEMYYPIPYNDDQTPGNMQAISTLMGFADIVTGQNKAQQGQFVKGNKTLHEYEDVMGNANGRSQLAAIVNEGQFFTPLKNIIVTNIMQYQGADTIYHEEKQADVAVDPVILRNAILKMKVSDGMIPSDKLIGADAWQTAMQVIGSSPQIGAAYNIAPMFSYLMKTQGAHIQDFEKSPEQQQFEQATSQWQQTVMQLAKDNPEIKPEQFPPQPKPADYGIGQDGQPTNAAQKAQQESQESIIQRILEADQQAAESQEPPTEA
jgi:hypothetical protein